MKPIAFCYLNCFLLLAILSCSKKDKINLNNDKIIGVWYEEQIQEEDNRISRLEYHFKEDGVLEVLRIEIEKNSRIVLGYRYRRIGNYKLESDQLTFYNLLSYSNDDTKGPYTEIEKLEILTESEGISYTITYKFEENDKKLIFIYPPCDPAANCIGSTTLIKE
jgi:hypothetical protein